MLILTIISIPLIIVIAELAYRWIEKPGIAAGKMLAVRLREPVEASRYRTRKRTTE
jgi:peptidoglycan/LPS O-acetylase OafA/YrhL